MNQSINLVVVAALLTLPLPACDPDEEPAETEAIVDQAIASVFKQPNWRSVIIREADPSGFSLAIDYAAPPLDFQVEEDTEKMARAVRLQLVMSGHRRPTIVVFGVQTGLKDENGADLTRSYGAATYDPKSDNVKFDPVH